MKSKSLSDPSSVSPDVIESILMQLGIRIAFDPLDRLVYREQDRIPEWRGADVRVTSDFDYEPKDFMEGHDLLVRTQHAKGLTWLIFELRDTFSGWIDAGNKYGFYGALAQAALSHLAANQPESDDARPLLNAVLVEAFRCLQMLREDAICPPMSPLSAINAMPKGGNSVSIWKTGNVVCDRDIDPAFEGTKTLPLVNI